MSNSHPSLKILSVFFISFLVTYAGINFIVSQINQREQQLHSEAAQILQQEVSGQFELVLDVTYVIGQMSSLYLNHESKRDENYGELIHKVLQDKEYILGLNQLNTDGKIISIYPKDDNQGAMGKVSQNFPELIKSEQRGERYWFSPPFQLFQGGQGFVFYIPIKSKGSLLGWMAPVISSQLFFDHFRTMDFFEKYDLVIKDQITGNIYFETGIPSLENDLQKIKSRMWERDIIFQTWPKSTNPKFGIPFYWRFLICLFVSLLCGFFMKTYLQKKKAYNRLENISDLLKLTSNEVLSKLIDMQNDFLSHKSSDFLSTNLAQKDIQSVTNIIEQIELLQNLAESEQIKEETFEILPLIKGHLDLLQEVVQKKHLSLNLDIDSFKEIKITGNKWLISNTVLKNALSFSALISCPYGKIDVSHTVSPRECSTIFYIEKILEKEISQAFKIERRLLVAQNVMGLLNGQISIHENGKGGMILKLSTEPIKS